MLLMSMPFAAARYAMLQRAIAARYAPVRDALLCYARAAQADGRATLRAF